MPAPGGWFFCEVIRVGPAEDGDIFIMLTDTKKTFGGRWFKAVQPERREMLATALAAFTSGFGVHAALVSTDEHSIINRLYIAKEA